MRKFLNVPVWSLVIGLSVLLPACQKPATGDYQKQAANPEPLRRAVHKLTEVITHDIFSPPVASRIYMYASIAAYEALVPQNSEYQSLAGQLNGYTASPKPEAGKTYCFPLASVRAFLAISRALTFKGEMYDDFEKKLYLEYTNMGMPDDVHERSLQYGDLVAKHILDYAKKDNYSQTRGFRHTISNAPGTWVPTPPAYMDGIEPRWATIRPLVMDSASQFAPARPPAFSLDKKSLFYTQVMEVYETVKHATDEQKWIANFWDCNPFKLNVAGHVNYATKKMSPGGHWMSIAGIVSDRSKADMLKTAEAYALVSITLFDGFISCWDEKYRSLMIRPETVINQHIDKDWMPLLQTPPFPEYTSGHSVISSASAVTLTQLYGEDFAFVDSTEVQYGIPPRSFQSFRQAADEAAISRLYGGIHYRAAIVEGVKQGRQIGEWVVGQVHTRKTLAIHARQTSAQ